MKPSTLGAVVLALLLSVRTQAAEPVELVKQHFQSGQKHYSLGEFEQAAEEFREAYRLQGEPALLFNIGQTLRMAGKLEEARFQYSQYLHYRPDATNRPMVEKVIGELDAAILARAKRESETGKYLEKEAPDFEHADPGFLKGGTLCVAPFSEDGRRDVDAKASGKRDQTIAGLQKLVFDVAKSSPLLKDSLGVGQDAQSCGIEDAACFATLGPPGKCTAVLAGRVTREDNGFTLRTRLVDARSGKLLAKASQVIGSGDETPLGAWAEGQACRGLKIACEGKVLLDADRAEMRILIDDQPIARTPAWVSGAPETLMMKPGIYRVRATFGQRQSSEVVLAVRRNQAETIYVRQTADGVVRALVKSELNPNEVPGPSKDLKAGTKPLTTIGIVAASLGVVAEGVAIQQYAHSQSLASGAADSYAANGYYKQADIAAVGSAKSAHANSTVLGALGAALIVAGAICVLAF
jgi:hypothetical protein